MGRVNGKNLKPTRWGMILAAFGRQKTIEPEKERLALLKHVVPPRPEEEQPQLPKARKI